MSHPWGNETPCRGDTVPQSRSEWLDNHGRGTKVTTYQNQPKFTQGELVYLKTPEMVKRLGPFYVNDIIPPDKYTLLEIMNDDWVSVRGGKSVLEEHLEPVKRRT